MISLQIKNSENENLKGRTLISSDWTTVLDADDKTRIAEILTLMERLNTENIPHGTICIAFTPDGETAP